MVYVHALLCIPRFISSVLTTLGHHYLLASACIHDSLPCGCTVSIISIYSRNDLSGRVQYSTEEEAFDATSHHDDDRALGEYQDDTKVVTRARS
jgi:hypothetical protein